MKNKILSVIVSLCMVFSVAMPIVDAVTDQDDGVTVTTTEIEAPSGEETQDTTQQPDEQQTAEPTTGEAVLQQGNDETTAAEETTEEETTDSREDDMVPTAADGLSDSRKPAIVIKTKPDKKDSGDKTENNENEKEDKEALSGGLCVTPEPESDDKGDENGEKLSDGQMPAQNTEINRRELYSAPSITPNLSEGNAEGLELTKTATDNGDGTYGITCEAYVTGKVKTQTVTSAADIVLVFDTSRSMTVNDTVLSVNSTDTATRKAELAKLSSAFGGSEGIYTLHISSGGYGGSNFSMRYNADEEDWQFYRQKQWISLSRYSAQTDNYRSFTVQCSRMDKLRIAAKQFVEMVVKNSADSSIGITTFSNSASEIIGLTKVSGAGAVENLFKAIDGLVNSQGTKPSTGIAKGGEMLRNDSKNTKCMVVFTDGEPNEGRNPGIEAASALKKEGVLIYTVGVFTTVSDQVRNYLNYISSKYPNATSEETVGSPVEGTFSYTVDTATDLSTIFKTITEDIIEQTLGIDLGENTVLEDAMSRYFVEHEDDQSGIKVYKAKYLGYNADGSRKFGDRIDITSEVEVSVTKDGKTVDVKGFDYSENCVLDKTVEGKTTYSGYKLIVAFNIVPEEGFLGGDHVPTNDGSSGIYNGDDVIGEFEIPHVDVPIADDPEDLPDGFFETKDITVYYGDTVDNKELYTLNEKNIAGWIGDYINKDNLSVTVSPAVDATKCGEYKVTLKLVSKNNSKNYKQITLNAKVHVLVPEVTWKDAGIYLGQAAVPSGSYVSTTWTELSGHTDHPKPEDDKPELRYSYDIANVYLREKTGVSVTVRKDGQDITPVTSFKNSSGSVADHAGSVLSNEFYIDVKTCTLTITKKGCNLKSDPSQSFVFVINGENAQDCRYADEIADFTVSVEGNGTVTVTGLPVGKYTVTEDADWSWRYESEQAEYTATLKPAATASHAECIINNTRKNASWLSDETVCDNRFGKPGQN